MSDRPGFGPPTGPLPVADNINWPEVHVGTADGPLPDWRATAEADGDDDPDDEQIETPPDVADLLGFDPATEPTESEEPEEPAA
jgi:hypothetical protein